MQCWNILPTLILYLIFILFFGMTLLQDIQNQYELAAVKKTLMHMKAEPKERMSHLWQELLVCGSSPALFSLSWRIGSD